MRIDELFDLVMKYKIKECYVTPHLFDVEFESGWILVDRISDKFVEEVDKKSGGLVSKNKLYIRESNFDKGNRMDRAYCIPNLIKEGKLVERPTGSRKEKLVQILKRYGVQNCYVTKGMNLDAKNPYGRIVTDIPSEALNTEIFWLYVDYVNDLDEYYYVCVTSTDFSKEKEWKPNFVVEGVFHDADF